MEFALTLLVLLALLYGILEVSKLMLINSEIDNAAREAAHYAALHTGVDGAYLRANIVEPKLALVGQNSPDLAVSNPVYPAGGIGAFLPVQVTITYTWTSAVHIVPDMSTWQLKPLGPIVLRGTATSLIEGH